MSRVAGNYPLSQIKRTEFKAHDHKKNPQQLGRIVAVKFVCDHLATIAASKTPSSRTENRFALLSGNAKAKKAFAQEIISLLRKAHEDSADLAVALPISDKSGETKEVPVFDFQKKTLEKARDVIGNSGKLTEDDKLGLTALLNEEIVRMDPSKFDKK